MNRREARRMIEAIRQEIVGSCRGNREWKLLRIEILSRQREIARYANAGVVRGEGETENFIRTNNIFIN